MTHSWSGRLKYECIRVLCGFIQTIYLRGVLSRRSRVSSGPFSVWQGFQYCRRQQGTTRHRMGDVSFPPVTPPPLGQQRRQGSHRRQQQALEGVREGISMNTINPSYLLSGLRYPVICDDLSPSRSDLSGVQLRKRRPTAAEGGGGG